MEPTKLDTLITELTSYRNIHEKLQQHLSGAELCNTQLDEILAKNPLLVSLLSEEKEKVSPTEKPSLIRSNWGIEYFGEVYFTAKEFHTIITNGEHQIATVPGTSNNRAYISTIYNHYSFVPYQYTDFLNLGNNTQVVYSASYLSSLLKKAEKEYPKDSIKNFYEYLNRFDLYDTLEEKYPKNTLPDYMKYSFFDTPLKDKLHLFSYCDCIDKTRGGVAVPKTLREAFFSKIFLERINHTKDGAYFFNVDDSISLSVIPKLAEHFGFRPTYFPIAGITSAKYFQAVASNNF